MVPRGNWATSDREPSTRTAVLTWWTSETVPCKISCAPTRDKPFTVGRYGEVKVRPANLWSRHTAV